LQLRIKQVVFADLDGTLLNDRYEYKETKPIVDQITACGGSVVFCSSKTRSEIEYYRKKVGLNEPFISENGAAIFIPKDYFPFQYNCTTTPSYHVIRLGAPYHELRKKLAEIKRKTAAKIVGFGDMSLHEVAADTGLPLSLAELAKNREHDEPFKLLEGNKNKIKKAVHKEGLKLSEGGRYFHLTGNSDKGKAASVLKELYSQMFGTVETFGIGDGPNDVPMLKMVDRAFHIKKSGGFSASLNAWKGILQQISDKMQLN
jgi:mannosyl-3-phosphoglycerate phosphatase